ncbi:hypothetical protein D3C81_1902620 [compost metagenome]
MLMLLQRLIHGLTQWFDATLFTLRNTQALASDEGRVDVIGAQCHARLLPVAQLLGGAHRVIGGVQPVFQGGDTRSLQPGGAEDAGRTGHLAQLIEIRQVTHPGRAVGVQVGEASQ